MFLCNCFGEIFNNITKTMARYIGNLQNQGLSFQKFLSQFIMKQTL